MKPSERINEIYSKTVDDQMIPQEYRNLAMLNAIIDYLDEQYEKKQKGESTCD